MNVFRKKQQLVIILTAVVLVAGFVFLRYLPLRRKAKTLNQTHAARTATIQQGEQKAQQLPAMQNRLDELKNELADYDSSIPLDSGMGEFLSKVAKLMDEHELTAQMIEPQPEVRENNLRCIPVKMKCQGRLSQIRPFYESLQSLDRTVRIQQFTLSNDRDYAGNLTMETRAIVYCRSTAKQG